MIGHKIFRARPNTSLARIAESGLKAQLREVESPAILQA